MAPVLGYWSLRGLCEPIRTLLAYTGTNYEEKIFDIGPGPDYDLSQWTSVKTTLGLDLPNLPYWIDGDVKMSESTAILRHLARKHDLCGSTEQEKIRIDVAEGVLADLFRATCDTAYADNVEEKMKEFPGKADEGLQKLAKALGAGPYVAGNKISYVDFLLLEQLERYEVLVPGSVDKYSTLAAFRTLMTSLPAIKKYRDGAAFQKIKTRFFGRMCKYGGGDASY